MVSRAQARQYRWVGGWVGGAMEKVSVMLMVLLPAFPSYERPALHVSLCSNPHLFNPPSTVKTLITGRHS